MEVRDTPLFLALHTWKPENFNKIGKKVIESMPRLPAGTKMLYSYVDARKTGAWCVYETEKPEQVAEFWDKNVPEMGRTQMVPLLQFFPPGPELYMIIHEML